MTIESWFYSSRVDPSSYYYNKQCFEARRIVIFLEDFCFEVNKRKNNSQLLKEEEKKKQKLQTK